MKKYNKKLKNAFLAHEENGFRPHAFRHKWLSFYTLALMLSHYLTFGIALTGALINNPEIFSKDVIYYTNVERENRGLGALKSNPSLKAAAQNKLNHMISNNYWDHVSPDGTQAWYFIDSSGYDYTFAGENLARGFNDPRKTVTAWMGSPAHRANLLKSQYVDIGVASANGNSGGKQTSITVQIFGKPVPVPPIIVQETTEPQTIIDVEAVKTTEPTKEIASNSDITQPKDIKPLTQEQKVLTLGEQVAKPGISLSNAFNTQNIPYISLWFIIFVFMILDARMLKKIGAHKAKRNKFQFRQLIVLNVCLFLLLLVGFAYIA